MRVFRQVHVVEQGLILHRADIVIPFSETAVRPRCMHRGLGLILEIDSREFHEGRFEQDHNRQNNYDRLGLHWMTLTPNQVERRRSATRRAVEGAFARSQGKNSYTSV
jgi:hypothetical protein